VEGDRGERQKWIRGEMREPGGDWAAMLGRGLGTRG
jgi:hypothetical protein